jgi:hypothetical protein
LLLLILLEHIEIDPGVVQLLRSPLANLSVIGDRYDIVSVLGTNHVQAIDGVIVTIFSENTVQNRCSFGSYVPLDDVT